MTRPEAMAALRAGKKLIHKLFSNRNTFSQVDDNIYVNEDQHPVKEDAFWQNFSAKEFDEGWMIFYEQEPEHIDIL